jgi:hypothetical protein
MPGRYEHNRDPALAERLHRVSLDGGADDSVGDVTEDGFHASLLIIEPAGAAGPPVPAGNWLLTEDEQGLVTLDRYPTPGPPARPSPASRRPPTTPAPTTRPTPSAGRTATAAASVIVPPPDLVPASAAGVAGAAAAATPAAGADNPSRRPVRYPRHPTPNGPPVERRIL